MADLRLVDGTDRQPTAAEVLEPVAELLTDRLAVLPAGSPDLPRLRLLCGALRAAAGLPPVREVR